MAYTIDPLNAASPLDSDFPASNVAAELRQLKARVNALADALTTAVNNAMPVGTIIAVADPSIVAANFMLLPAVPTNVSRTTYATLFAAIGTAWGAGDGSTTFGLPYVAAGSTLISGSIGTVSAGSVKAHTHFHEDAITVNQTFGPVYAGENLPTITVDIASQWEFGGVMHRRRIETEANGDVANLAAGTFVNFYIKHS